MKIEFKYEYLKKLNVGHENLLKLYIFRIKKLSQRNSRLERFKNGILDYWFNILIY